MKRGIDALDITIFQVVNKYLHMSDSLKKNIWQCKTTRSHNIYNSLGYLRIQMKHIFIYKNRDIVINSWPFSLP